jgi:4-hydroxybenzoate polyprenyltransferase
MLLAPTKRRSRWEIHLALGRVGGLPTVWSNCLAGWLLSGGGSAWILLLLGLGSTCLYLGGAYLNDAFDVEYDRRLGTQNPILSGAVGIDEVWRWGFGWLGAGTVLLVLLGSGAGALAALLLFSILLFDAVHKLVAFAPLLMGVCRLLLYLVSAAASDAGLTGPPIWAGIALAVYVTGLGYLARHERSKTAPPAWPAWLLGVPILLALPANSGLFWWRALLVSLVMALWILRSLRPTFWTGNRHVARTVSDLVAGIVIVDLLALAGGGSILVGGLFGVLFAVVLWLQRVAPPR